MMDFVAMLPCIQQVLSVSYKKECNVIMQSSKHEKKTFPHEFIFVLIPYFIGVILSKNILAKVGAGSKNKIKRGDDHIRALSIEGGIQIFFRL